jgi:small-conductance mechanosensitive channel
MDTTVLSPWIPAASAVLAGLLLAIVARVLVIRRIEALLRRTRTELDDLALASVRRHLPVWILLGAIVAASRLAPLSERAQPVVARLCTLAFLVSLTLAAAHLGSALLARQAGRAGATLAMTSLARNVLRIAVFAIGGLLVLANLGMSITPLLTALGVGSLAVALALQPTLSNLFAGVHLSLARPIRVGDFVELEGGKQGFVEDIGWRATRIRELPNNIVVVPNARLADMVLVNYAMPEPEQAALVQLGVAYGSDLAQVERVTVEVAKEVLQQVEGGVADFEPFIRFHTFGDSSIDFSVILRVRRFVDRYLLVHEFIKRLQGRYDMEGIEIPFPQRTLHFTEAPPLAESGALTASEPHEGRTA